MNKKEVVEAAELIGIQDIQNKSLEMIRGEMIHLGKLLIAGQVTP